MMTGRRRARGLAVIAMIVWGLATAGPAGAIGHSPPAGARDVLAPLAPALLPRCQVHLVDTASGLARLSGPVHLVCDGPWALAGRGATVADMTLELFKATASGWAEQPTGNGSELDYAPEALGAPLAVLVRLGTGLGPGAKPYIAAAVLVHTTTEPSPGGGGGPVPWAASGIVRAGGGEWLATGRATSAPPGPGVAVSIYRWGQDGWTLQGRPIGMPSGQLAGGGSITVASLTGPPGPDFVVRSFGADTNWLSVVSDVGGTWHAVPFDYGYGPTVAIDAAGVHGHLVETEADGCGCATGPETYTWEIYRDGAFRPTGPPGPAPACSPPALASAADPAGLLGLAFTAASCADGWALGTGDGPGYANGFVALFEQQRGEWQTVNIDDGTALGHYPEIYDVPLTLLDRLGSRIGPRVAASVGIGSVYRGLEVTGSSTLWTMSGAIAFQGTDWLLAAGEPLNGGNRLSVYVYRWSGGMWAEQASFRRVPDEGALVGTGEWYGVAPGSPGPTFVVRGVYPNWSARIAYTRGTWHLTP
ncbi:MAG: hypothetical protein ACLP7F_04545 [Acidimicrobiales bacterium]